MDISSIDKTEIDKFKNLAKEWWKHDGKFKTLHKFNPIRLEYIINTIKAVSYTHLRAHETV